MSALMKCRGTFMWIFFPGIDPLKIDVQHLQLERVHLHVAQQYRLLLPSTSMVRMEAWNASSLS